MFKFFKQKNQRHKLGAKGEKIARRLLKNKGLDILCNNYRVKAGEIDIVALDAKTICFVEVKTRSKSDYYRPADGLKSKQESRIIKAGLKYLQSINLEKPSYRFDLIEIIYGKWDVIEVRHWEAHFHQ